MLRTMTMNVESTRVIEGIVIHDLLQIEDFECHLGLHTSLLDIIPSLYECGSVQGSQIIKQNSISLIC